MQELLTISVLDAGSAMACTLCSTEWYFILLWVYQLVWLCKKLCWLLFQTTVPISMLKQCQPICQLNKKAPNECKHYGDRGSPGVADYPLKSLMQWVTRVRIKKIKLPEHFFGGCEMGWLDRPCKPHHYSATIKYSQLLHKVLASLSWGLPKLKATTRRRAKHKQQSRPLAVFCMVGSMVCIHEWNCWPVWEEPQVWCDLHQCSHWPKRSTKL